MDSRLTPAGMTINGKDQELFEDQVFS